MQITPDLIKYLESLARITLTEKEEEKVGAELQDILTYIDMLNELDTDNVEAMSHSFPIANAPESSDGAFVVPKTVNE